MKISESWLREWVDPPISTNELAERFTMAGLEVGSVASAAPDFDDIVVGEVLEVAQHPNADKLVLATVDYGKALSAIVGRDNMIGFQFHPEKSQAVGLALLENFIRWRP